MQSHCKHWTQGKSFHKTNGTNQQNQSGEATVQRFWRQLDDTEFPSMAANFQPSQATLLEHLPPKVLLKITHFCADDAVVGRKTLLRLSVMNKYLRNVTISRLFQRICFRDSPESQGDEIFHSLRRFMAAPQLWFHARTLGLYLRRRNCLGADHAVPTEPYHPLLLPELVGALVRMPEVTELYIHMDGTQGRNCMQGLQAAVHWGVAGRQLNIRSLTVSPDNWTGYSCECEQPDSDHEIPFLAALPQLKSFCFEGTVKCAPQSILNASFIHQTIASNLTQLRLYRSCSDPRSGFEANAWRDFEFSDMYLSEVTPNLEYLSILGELRLFPVSRLLWKLTQLPKLKYIDITDEQMKDDYHGSMEYLRAALETPPQTRPPYHSARLTYIEHLARNHTLNEYRPELANQTFEQCPQLRRICFVRSMVGEVYLRGYYDAVADSTGYISPEVKDADLADIPGEWRHGVPQMGLMPFPTFTPWDGFM